ncbi:short chain dehydrogenase [Corynebacterium kalinowskii]|uniref:Short chain dehydrogenase n=1 Tax=Corynebacterium kalinowskii TaxID=2675216 RepID=A0A6B8W1W6_9CORY|nr:alpha/beta hydrolase [Corynebacterium kalinowskii]QGU01638.1 short chain dehydrogenase [Corynebacterium kalinowskii]
MPQFVVRFLQGLTPSSSDTPGLAGLCQSGQVASTSVPVATYVAGPDDAPITVVFVHGFTLAAECYFLQVQHLVDNHPNVRSVLLDLRGHGQTGEVTPEECTIEGSADDVLAVIDQLVPTGEILLVGHSLGGHVVLNTIRRCSESVFQRIRGVILIATSIDSLSAQGAPRLLTTKLADKVYDAMEGTPEVVTKFRDDVADFLAPALAAMVFKRISTPYNLVKFHADMIHNTPLSTFVGYFDDLETHSEVAAAERLAQLPGFVLVGNDDHVTPLSQSERILELWPRAELRHTNKCGHMIILEAPELVNEALDELLA